MSIVAIIKNNERVTVDFIRNFFICEDHVTGEIFWRPDSQEGEGAIRIWIQHADSNPRILGIPADWVIKIDDNDLEQKFYEEIDDLNGKEISLERENYKFIFQF